MKIKGEGNMSNISNRVLNRFKSFKDLNIAILVIVAIIITLVLSVILGETFFSSNNFQSMAYQIPEFGFLALAMSVCMLSGGIDLSIVSTATISSILAAFTLTSMSANGSDVTLTILLAVAVSIVTSLICGLINGLLIAKGSIIPILATMATMIFYKGIAIAITDGAGVVGFPVEFIGIGIVKLVGIPVIFLLFIIAAVIMTFILGRSHYGKCVYLYGENKTASLFSGIKNDRVIILTYMISGMFCGLAALIIMMRANSARAGYGETYLMQAILVCVLGGLDPDGGKGKVVGVFLGILVLQLLQSGFTLLEFPPYVKKLIWGLALIFVMILNYQFKKRRRFRMRKNEDAALSKTVAG